MNEPHPGPVRDHGLEEHPGLDVVIGADLQSLVSSHQQTDFASVLVFKQFHVTWELNFKIMSGSE